MEKFCVYGVEGILLCLLVLLVACSAAVTCQVYEAQEVVEYRWDSPALHLLFLAALTVLGAAWIANRPGGSFAAALSPRISPVSKSTVRTALVIGAIYLLWLLLTMLLPLSDQASCIRCAKGLVEGDYSGWEPGGYAFYYPNQNGIILIFSLLYRLFGDATGFAVQVLNIPAMGCGIWYLYRCWQKLCPDDMRNGMLWVLALCLPFTFYITFSYGTVFGFAASMAACFQVLQFLEKPAAGGLVKAGLLAALAVQCKSNYSIVAVALVILCLVLAVDRRRLQYGLLAVALALFCAAGSWLVTWQIERITSLEVGEGIPKLAWVEMGLEEGSRGPGWFNFYITDVFEEAGGDSQAAGELVRQDLAETLRNMGEDPAATADFFARKIASLWAEPTFQSVWIQEVKASAMEPLAFVESLLHRGGILNTVYVAVSNVFQTFVYFFSLVWLVRGWRERNLRQLLPAIIFIGGFLFHLAWEAKGQYSVFYFFLLVPCALQGYRACALKAASWWEKRKEKIPKTEGESM